MGLHEIEGEKGRGTLFGRAYMTWGEGGYIYLEILESAIVLEFCFAPKKKKKPLSIWASI